jgi:hypothetical protein
MEEVGMFYGHLVYFTAIWYILWPFRICNLWYVYFSYFGMFCQEKSGNPVLGNELQPARLNQNVKS